MKKYLNLQIVVTSIILLYVAFLACDGIFLSKLPARAMAFPGFVFSLAGIVGVLEIIRCVRAVNAEEAKEPGQRKAKTPLLEDPKRFFEIVALIILYFALMLLLGFIPAGVIFSIIYGFRQKYPKRIQYCVIMILTICFWYYLFSAILGVKFPSPLVLQLMS